MALQGRLGRTGLTRGLAFLLVLAAGAMGLTACQGGESQESTTDGQTLQMKADPDGGPKFLRTAFFAKPGEVTIEFSNESSMQHNVTIVGPVTMDTANNRIEPIEGPDTETTATETISNSTTSVVVNLKKADEDRPGQYYFYCSVDGHQAAGMFGVIIAKD